MHGPAELLVAENEDARDRWGQVGSGSVQEAHVRGTVVEMWSHRVSINDRSPQLPRG